MQKIIDRLNKEATKYTTESRNVSKTGSEFIQELLDLCEEERSAFIAIPSQQGTSLLKKKSIETVVAGPMNGVPALTIYFVDKSAFQFCCTSPEELQAISANLAAKLEAR